MKSMTGHLFNYFIVTVGVILAVLALILGQLFPFFSDHVEEKRIDAIEQKVILQLQEENVTSSTIQDVQNTLHEHIENDQVREEKVKFTIILILIFITAFIIILYTTKVILRNFLDPIENITKTAKELSIGNYRARAYAVGPQSIVELKKAVNRLANNLESITKKRLIEEERLNTLVETMGNGLIMMNREGQVKIVNRHFLNKFELAYDQVNGKSFLTLDVPQSLKDFIDHVFLTEHTERKQLKLEQNGEISYKEVYGAPVVGEHGKWLGVVIVLHDVTELIRLEQIRKDFVANVSHELRTPITSIKGFTETLLDGAYKDEVMLLSFLEIVYKESNRLQELVNDLLELSKLEQQGYEIAKERVQLSQVLERIAAIEKQKLQDKSIALSYEVSEDLFVLGEENRIIQIFTNLVNNAIMYSPEHSTITIRQYTEPKFAVVEVQDQGIGIAKADLKRVFERFYRVDAARSRNSGGTGLGLSIVKHLVELHDGKIEVESSPGNGTLMRVKIPLY